MAGKVYSFDGVVPVIDPTAFVHPTAVMIGDVRIGPHCYIGPGVSLRGDFSAVILGEGCNVQDNAVLHGTPHLDTVVEAGGHIGHGAVVHACHVGPNVLIGVNAAVFDGAVIGECAIVAALSFVRAGFEVPPRTLVAGAPAKVVRPLTDADIARKSLGTEAYRRLARYSRETIVECQPLAEPEPGRRQVDLSTFWPMD
ncbi:MAG: transferase hexapeptide repeat family protein [Solirubrobacterales bacterium]